MKYLISILLILSSATCLQAAEDIFDVQTLGTRSWIRVSWKKDENRNRRYELYWATSPRKPEKVQAVLEGQANRYYIEEVEEEKQYWIWIDVFEGQDKRYSLEKEEYTGKEWKLIEEDLKELQSNPSSKAVPKGMELVWHDEFKELLLNKNKWSTNYYSSIDELRGDFRKDMENDNLAQPAYILNGETIDLYVSDSLPVKVYDQKNNKKISSIQTYDWRKDESLLDNSRGGYFEVKVKRSNTGKPRGLNTAFWFDAPGPDLRNYLQKGTEREGVKGVRPIGQVFEIDVFEYISAQFVLHGHVDENGKFLRNLDTHIAKGFKHFDTWVVHGIEWSPTTVKHYINGKLIKAYTDKSNMHSPNHFMNVLLGSYGGGATVNMEVDYIRMYQWPLEGDNELPNPDFEYTDKLAPWEGNGRVEQKEGLDNSNAARLDPNTFIEQYFYLDNGQEYKIEFYVKGEGKVKVEIDDLTLVTGEREPVLLVEGTVNEDFEKHVHSFKSGVEYADYQKKMRVSFENTGPEPIFLDRVFIRKER